MQSFLPKLFAVLLVSLSFTASATEWLYSDSVQPHWDTTNSYDVTMDPSAVYPTPHSGSHDLQAVYTASWGAVHFDNVSGGYVGQKSDNIVVWFYDYDTNHSSLSSDVEVTLFDTNGNMIGTADFRDGYASSLSTMQWNKIEVPLSDLDAEGETIGAVELESENLLIMYFDDVHFTGGTGGGDGGGDDGGGSCNEAQSAVMARMGMMPNDDVCLNTSGPSLWFFRDRQAPETETWYWNVTNNPNTPVSSPVYEGTKAMKAHFQPGVNETGDAGLQFHSDVNFDPDTDTQSIVFALRGNISPSNLTVSLIDGSSGGGNPIGNSVSVDDYTAGCSPTGGWCTIQIPMSALISFSPANHLSGFSFESTQSGTEYLDEVRVVGVIPKFKLPLPGGKHWRLEVESGGEVCDGTHDSNHDSDADYYALDFDPVTTEDGLKSNVHVLAAAAGVVAQVGLNDPYNGNYVVIDHDIDGDINTGIITYYLHMQNGSILVQEGDSVVQGQELGIMGNTGDSTGTHIHFQFDYNGQKHIDAPYLSDVTVEGTKITDYHVGSSCQASNDYYYSTNTEQ